MNWYVLYVNGNKRGMDVTLHASQTKASSFTHADHALRITYGTPGHVVRAWRYDHGAQAWRNEQPGEATPVG